MKKDICFVSFASLPLLTSDENLKYIGGAELTSVFIGKELAKRGYRIKFITFDENIKDDTVDGISIIRAYPVHKKYSEYKKGSVMWKSLKKADADIYFQANGPAGIIPLFCILHGKKYVKWVASDSDLVLERINTNHTLLSKLTANFDIKFAHKMIVQNRFQKDITEKKFRRDCVLIKNPMILPDPAHGVGKNKNSIVWVGTIRSVKQPELFLEIAQAFPEYRFLMIGGDYIKERDVFENIKKDAKKIPNLEVLGFIPHHKIQKYYEEALLIVNTSKIEGFPNTFLEAWINGIPVVSLNADPDEIICTAKLGFHSKTYEQILKDIHTLMTNDGLRREMGLNATKYVEENHDVKKIANQFEDLIKSFDT